MCIGESAPESARSSPRSSLTEPTKWRYQRPKTDSDPLTDAVLPTTGAALLFKGAKTGFLDLPWTCLGYKPVHDERENRLKSLVFIGGKGGTRTLDPGIMRSGDKEKVRELQAVVSGVVQISTLSCPMLPSECLSRGHKK